MLVHTPTLNSVLNRLWMNMVSREEYMNGGCIMLFEEELFYTFNGHAYSTGVEPRAKLARTATSLAA